MFGWDRATVAPVLSSVPERRRAQDSAQLHLGLKVHLLKVPRKCPESPLPDDDEILQVYKEERGRASDSASVVALLAAYSARSSRKAS